MIRRFPAILWVLVYVGSLLVLNGAHGNWDPLELALGLGLPAIAFAIALYFAVGPWRGHPRPPRLMWFLWGTLAIYVLAAVPALIFAGPDAAVATLLAALIPATAAALWIASARSKTVGDEERFGDATKDAHDDPFPGVGIDPVRPLGDTPDAHDEITPHDLPKNHPGRRAAERQAAGSNGTTTGHRDGGAADTDTTSARDGEPLVPREEARRGAGQRR